MALNVLGGVMLPSPRGFSYKISMPLARVSAWPLGCSMLSFHDKIGYIELMDPEWTIIWIRIISSLQYTFDPMAIYSSGIWWLRNVVYEICNNDPADR